MWYDSDNSSTNSKSSNSIGYNSMEDIYIAIIIITVVVAARMKVDVVVMQWQRQSNLLPSNHNQSSW